MTATLFWLLNQAVSWPRWVQALVIVGVISLVAIWLGYWFGMDRVKALAIGIITFRRPQRL